jgi:hypothetical protein
VPRKVSGGQNVSMLTGVRFANPDYLTQNLTNFSLVTCLYINERKRGVSMTSESPDEVLVLGAILGDLQAFERLSSVIGRQW